VFAGFLPRFYTVLLSILGLPKLFADGFGFMKGEENLLQKTKGGKRNGKVYQ